MLGLVYLNILMSSYQSNLCNYLIIWLGIASQHLAENNRYK